jgi:hypothetical protein
MGIVGMEMVVSHQFFVALLGMDEADRLDPSDSLDQSRLLTEAPAQASVHKNFKPPFQVKPPTTIDDLPSGTPKEDAIITISSPVRDSSMILGTYRALPPESQDHSQAQAYKPTFSTLNSATPLRFRPSKEVLALTIVWGLFFNVLAEELMIFWNAVQGVNSIGSTGQLLATLVGLFTLARFFWELCSSL